MYARYDSSMCDSSFKPLANGLMSRGAFVIVTWILLFICDLKANSNILYSSSIETRSGASVRSAEVNPVESDSGYLQVSLLAVVTTAVSFYGVGDARLSYLETILNNFKDVCEIGLDVSVILTAYEGAADAWLEYLSSRYGTCRRNESSLRYDLELFPFRKLPPHASGTAGDLAIRHREIFLRERNNFDFFLVQEDDASYTAETVRYFLDNLRTTQRLSPSLFPSFFDYEVFKGVKYAGFRMHAGYIFVSQGEYFFTTTVSFGGRGYLVPQTEILKFAQLDSWADPQAVVGEFNPKVASLDVLSAHKRLVHPLTTWKSGGVHHLPNKYIVMEFEKKEADSKTASLRFEELDFIFSACLKKGTLAPQGVRVVGDCAKCLASRGYVKMRSDVLGPSRSSHRNLTVSFRCSIFNKVTFRGLKKNVFGK